METVFIDLPEGVDPNHTEVKDKVEEINAALKSDAITAVVLPFGWDVTVVRTGK
jgi:hypothetical protein